MQRKLPIKLELPESFFEEEIRNGYLISSQMKKVWAVELDLLQEFSEVCKRLGVNYFIDSGNLLGAARNGKFIPWDDDIDIVMMREDYDLLVKEGSGLFDEPYFFQCAYTDREYPRTHSQLRNSYTCAMMRNEADTVRFNQGIFIDIFPLDGISSDIQREVDTIKKIIKPIDYISYHHSQNILIEALKFIRSRLFILLYGNIPDIISKMENYVRQYNSSEYIDKIVVRDNTDDVRYLKRKWFDDSAEIEFENFKVKGPCEFSKVLSLYYGKDFMIPKQISSIHGTNGNMIFNADVSFNEVIENMRTMQKKDI